MEYIIGILLLVTFVGLAVYAVRGGNLMMGMLIMGVLWTALPLIGNTFATNPEFIASYPGITDISFVDAITNVFQAGPEGWGSVLVNVVFGAWFGRVLLQTGIADTLIRKAVELGVSRIVPLAMEHSVVRYDGDKAAKKRERWQKIAESAAKQSKRDIIPEVAAVTTMDRLMAECDCTTKIIAYECEDKQGLKQALRANPQTDSILVIIGPEGGISEAELNPARTGGAVPVSLGRRILRAVTAGLTALSAILYEFDELGG